MYIRSLRSTEDYLATILQLSKDQKDQKEQSSNKDNTPVRIKDIAEKLNISSPSVSEFVRKLEKANKVTVVERKGVVLTADGIREAQLIINKHQIIECFLVEILKIDKEKAHFQSHDLEHVMELETIDKLYSLITSIRGQCNLETCKYKELCKSPSDLDIVVESQLI